MSRSLAAANVTASEAAHVRPIDFAEIQFDSGTLRIHNGLGDITWNSLLWTGAGGLVGLGPIIEATDSAPRRFWMQLNAVDSSVLTEALEQEVYRRLVTVYTGFLNAAGVLVTDPHDNMYSGFADGMPVSVGGPIDSIRLECELEVALDHRANGARFTDEDQQDLYSGDTGFEYLPQMIQARPHWGPGGHSVNFGVSVGAVPVGPSLDPDNYWAII